MSGTGAAVSVPVASTSSLNNPVSSSKGAASTAAGPRHGVSASLGISGNPPFSDMFSPSSAVNSGLNGASYPVNQIGYSAQLPPAVAPRNLPGASPTDAGIHGSHSSHLPQSSSSTANHPATGAPTFTSSLTVMPATSGGVPVVQESEPSLLLDEKELSAAGQHADEVEESDRDSVSVSESSSVGSDDKDSEAEEPDVGETQSAISKVSNRSSPSVLSATIHQWPGYEEESHGLLEHNEEASEESENEDPEDPWRIQPDQRQWYLTLFLRMQPDVNGHIEGKDARVFFENSQLPLQDLGEIWNCSDVDRDGRLTLAEFCYAMHLSVARRHGMQVPSQLPPSLRNSTKPILKAAQDYLHGPPGIPAGDNAHNTEWTKFGESPRNRGPVQFRSSLDTEKKLPHPIAVKVANKSTLSPKSATAVRDVRSFSTGTVGMPNSMSLVAPTSGTVPSTTLSQDAVIAPPPPPRSWHSRSASLDLQGPQSQAVGNKPAGTVVMQTTSLGSASAVPPPPQLPPRSSPIISRRLDSATSESEGESRYASYHPSGPDVKPEKPPRVTRVPVKNVSFAPGWTDPSGQHSGNQGPITILERMPVLDLALESMPSAQDIELLKPAEVAGLLHRFRIAVEGLTKQNADLQQQLTDVVLKKRTAESQLAGEKNAHR